MERKYSIEVTKNGFIIRFEHLEKSYNAANQAVARTVEELAEIIKEDLSTNSDKISSKLADKNK